MRFPIHLWNLSKGFYIFKLEIYLQISTEKSNRLHVRLQVTIPTSVELELNISLTKAQQCNSMCIYIENTMLILSLYNSSYFLWLYTYHMKLKSIETLLECLVYVEYVSDTNTPKIMLDT